MNGQNGLYLGKFEKRRPILHHNAFTQLENHSQLLCGRDFENERLFPCQFDVLNS